MESTLYPSLGAQISPQISPQASAPPIHNEPFATQSLPLHHYTPQNLSHQQSHLEQHQNLQMNQQATQHQQQHHLPYVERAPNCPPVARFDMSTSKIELSISCRNLLNRDILSKSDPFCVVWLRESGARSTSEQYRRIGETEIIRDQLNPRWAKKVLIDFCFELHQELKFEVWDYDSAQKSEELGEHLTTVANIVSKSGAGTYTGSLRHQNRLAGEISIECEELLSSKLNFNFQFSLSQSSSPSLLCGFLSPVKNDSRILELSRSSESGGWTVVHRTQKIPNIRNADDQHFNVNIRCQTLCNGDFERSIKLEVFQWKRSGKHESLGEKIVTLADLIGNEQASNSPNVNIPKQRSLIFKQAKKFSIRAPKGKQKANNNNNNPLDGNKGKQVCEISLHSVQITEQYSFLDYVRAGMQVHFAVAIDFTASNLPPDDPASLHFLDMAGNYRNQYEMSLRAIGEIIEPYDTVKLLPAFGFGAKLRQDNFTKVSHQFPLNGNSNYPYLSNISELVYHYRQSLTENVLSGPTNFSSVIRSTALISRKFSEIESGEKMRGQHYFILLIITDGIIGDYDRTVDEIIDASTLPMSIIIIGVGDTDFDSMHALDSDAQVLQSGSRKAARDIVQFVPLKPFLTQDSRTISSTASLSAEVLEEIPEQIRAYMALSSIEPSQIRRVKTIPIGK